MDNNKLLNIDAVREIKNYVDNSTLSAGEGVTIEDNTINAVGKIGFYTLESPIDYNSNFVGASKAYKAPYSTALSNIITDAYNKGYHNIVLQLTYASYEAGSGSYFVNDDIQAKRPAYCFWITERADGEIMKGVISGSWSGDVYTCSSLSLVHQATWMAAPNAHTYDYKINQYLMHEKNSGPEWIATPFLEKTNTTEFTPTGEYHPATKKYVDDSVATLGDYVDEQLANIDAGGNSNSPSIPEYVLEASYTEFVNTNGDGIHQKVEVLRPDEQTFSNVKAIFADVVEKDIRVFNIRLKNINDNKDHCLLTCNTGGHPSYSGMNYVTFSGIYTKDSLNTITEIHLGITFMDGGINPPTSMNWYRYTMKGYSSYAFKSDLNTYGLSKTNTTEFTPTADYHPSTKKYVDDAISTAITTALEAEY